MKIYHTATQEDYDALMIELEIKGYKWFSGHEPTAFNYWEQNKESSCIKTSCKDIAYSDIEQYEKKYPYTPIIEYKAEGDNVTQEEMKYNLQEIEPALQEAKSSAKKLIEKIDDYLESLKPEFKVGDYVVEQNGDVISKIVEVINGDFWGPYYKKAINFFGNLGAFIRDKDIERYATPSEIEEYEVALTFHKHGRKPFEVKQGDILRDDEGNIFFVDFPSIRNKEYFTSGDYTFIKTVEEVNEWLKIKKTEK